MSHETLTQDHQRQPVTILGLGPMGQALAGALLQAGHSTTVWNRTPEKAEALVARGARRAQTPAEAVTASPLTIACVIDYDAVHTIVRPAAEELRGHTLVNLTADTPARARDTAAWAIGHGIDYLDGAIMTPTTTIGTDDALVLYSGPEAVFERHRSTLQNLGGRARFLGADPGRAAAHDVALLDLFWTSMSGLVHAFALARSEGIAAAELRPYVQGVVGLLPDIATEFADRIDKSRHVGDQSTILSAVAGIEHIIHAAEQRGLDTGVLYSARAIAQRAIDARHGEDGFSRLTETLSAPATAAS
jgi:3-hydroxyisobutyrate dehydrogenase-like beta-hydroxyacid dehydrogenase